MTKAEELANAILEAKDSRPKQSSNRVFLDYRDWEFIREIAREVLRELRK